LVAHVCRCVAAIRGTASPWTSCIVFVIFVITVGVLEIAAILRVKHTIIIFIAGVAHVGRLRVVNLCALSTGVASDIASRRA
jgi:hypothetical protein